jgi:hypothetical protein
VLVAGTSATLDQEDDTDTSDPEPPPGLRAAPQDLRPAVMSSNVFRKLHESGDSPSKRMDILAGMQCAPRPSGWSVGGPACLLGKFMELSSVVRRAACVEEATRQLNSNSNSPEQAPRASKRLRMDGATTRARGNDDEDVDGSSVPSTSSQQVAVVDEEGLDDGYRRVALRWRLLDRARVRR